MDGYMEPVPEALEAAGSILEEEGYRVDGYRIGLFMDSSCRHHYFTDYHDSPQDAYDSFMAGIREETETPQPLTGQEIYSIMEGEMTGTDVVLRNLRGVIDLHGAPVDEDHGPEEPVFGTSIQYIPATSMREEKLEVHNQRTRPPYDETDAEQRVSRITDTLEENGFNTEPGLIR